MVDPVTSAPVPTPWILVAVWVRVPAVPAVPGLDQTLEPCVYPPSTVKLDGSAPEIDGLSENVPLATITFGRLCVTAVLMALLTVSFGVAARPVLASLPPVETKIALLALMSTVVDTPVLPAVSV